MPQQKGFKRAIKVATRKKKLVKQAKLADIRREVRKVEVAVKEAEKEKATK